MFLAVSVRKCCFRTLPGGLKKNLLFPMFHSHRIISIKKGCVCGRKNAKLNWRTLVQVQLSHQREKNLKYLDSCFLLGKKNAFIELL